MAVLKKVISHPHIVDHFKEPPFYKNNIETPKVKRSKH